MKRYKHDDEPHRQWLKLLWSSFAEWDEVIKLKKHLSLKGWKTVKGLRKQRYNLESTWQRLGEKDQQAFIKFHKRYVEPFKWEWQLIKKGEAND